jgi:hypothetical protein
LSDEQRWIPVKADHVRWHQDPQAGRVWRVEEELVGLPPRFLIVPEAAPGAGVQTDQPEVVALDDLEPAV